MTNILFKPHEDVDAFLMRWSQEWLEDAVKNERVSEVPYCLRALNHLHSQQNASLKAAVVEFKPGRRRASPNVLRTAGPVATLA